MLWRSRRRQSSRRSNRGPRRSAASGDRDAYQKTLERCCATSRRRTAERQRPSSSVQRSRGAIPDSEGGTESEEPRQASLPDLLVTKAKQTGATVTFIEDAPCSKRPAASAGSCDGARKLAFGLLLKNHVQDH
jgi:hypothetical protein